jgi:membrane protease subunit HflC
MNKKLAAIGVLIVLLAIVASQSFFIVRETDQSIVLQFGEPVRTVNEPGLYFKIPFVQDVTVYERRILSADPPVEQVLLIDQRRLNVDAFVRYRITDPLTFFQAVRDEQTAAARISNFTNSALRETLGDRSQAEILSEERADIMASIQERVEADTEDRFGIDIIDVRIGRTDLPEETLQSVYARMRSEREREAAEFRAQGEEQAQQIRARADRERTVLLSEAERDSQIIRGEGDAQAIRVLADAYTEDEAFFAFFRTMEAYRNSLGAGRTSMVLSPTGDFFRYFQDLTGSEIELPDGSPAALDIPRSLTPPEESEGAPDSVFDNGDTSGSDAPAGDAGEGDNQ